MDATKFAEAYQRLATGYYLEDKPVEPAPEFRLVDAHDWLWTALGAVVGIVTVLALMGIGYMLAGGGL